MASGPDLFVVCKKCGSEVSPYITECPYCGTRLRKRAPKIERGGVGREPKPPRRRRTLPRLKPGEIPGIRAERRPYATITIVLASIIVTLASRAGLWDVSNLLLWANTTDEYYRTVTTLFFYGHTGYEVMALGAIFLFGWLLERRHGAWAPVLLFFAGGSGGMLVADAVQAIPVALGGNGAALAMLGAWVVPDLQERRHGETDSDLIGVVVIAAVLLLLPVAVREANPIVAAAGGVIGLVLGMPLAALSRLR
jgi:membrane associated rhomboid family serine protease